MQGTLYFDSALITSHPDVYKRQPMTYFMEVAKDWGMEPGSTDAAVKAIAQCSWEWAAQYCFYAFYAVALGIAAFNHAQPLRVSSFAYLATGRSSVDVYKRQKSNK